MSSLCASYSAACSWEGAAGRYSLPALPFLLLSNSDVACLNAYSNTSSADLLGPNRLILPYHFVRMRSNSASSSAGEGVTLVGGGAAIPSAGSGVFVGPQEESYL
jgi:hypothetical protein